MCLQSHYRNQLTFSYESLTGAENSYKKLKNRVLNLSQEGEIDQIKFDEYNTKFKEFIGDDLNTANAITLMYDVLKDDINDKTKLELIKSFDEVFSLKLTVKEESNTDIDEEFILKKIEERNTAKQNKDYALADQIRNELLELGITLKDTREGTIYEK